MRPQKNLKFLKNIHGFGLKIVVFLMMTVAGWLAPGPLAEAQLAGGLQLIPTRIIFEGRSRSAEVNLINNGQKTETYRMSFKNMRMTEDGQYQDIKAGLPDEKFAKPYIVYSPRQVTLGPGESQTIRLLLRKKKNMAVGEYRSHFFVRTLPPKDFGKSLEDLAGDKKDNIRIQLIPVFGITIPVIVRNGKLSASVSLSDLGIEHSTDSKPVQYLKFSVNRKGSQSVFGDFKVTYSPREGGDSVEVARLNGVWVFTPNKKRNMKIRLNPPSGKKLAAGTLTVTYRENPEYGDQVLAETQSSIP